jgi:hypothetical protein
VQKSGILIDVFYVLSSIDVISVLQRHYKAIPVFCVLSPRHDKVQGGVETSILLSVSCVVRSDLHALAASSLVKISPFPIG